MSKILVIGLDGATLDLVKPWAEQGKLPALARIMERGVYGRLLSVMPVLSSAAWPSFMTGMNPGKHGLYDFVQRDLSNYRLRLLRRDHIRAPSIWKILSQRNYRVGVINVPMTYPPEEVNGFIVTGLGTPDTRIFTYPAELSQELIKRGYRVNKRLAYQPSQEAAYLHEVHHIAEKQFEAALWLMQARPWDFFMTVFFDTDQLAHFYWRYMDPGHPQHDPREKGQFSSAILDYYQKIDGYIDRLVQAAGPDTDIVILSDHGAGPLYKDVFLNEWLRQQGYLALEQEVATYRGYRSILARLGITRRGISAFLRKRGWGGLETWLTQHLGDLVFILPRTPRAEFPTSIDWSRTRAYSFGYQGQIYINLKGREPMGIVAPGDEYDQLLQEITAKLGQLTDPTDGKPVVDQVFRKEEIFHGPYVDMAPDLTLVMRGMAYITRYGYENSPQAGKVFSMPTTHESGSHRQDGLFLMYGPKVKNLGGLSQVAHLIDLAPTILYLMGCPIPADMDGRVLSELLATDDPIVIDHDQSGQMNLTEPGSLTDAEEREMIERLRGMGYLE